ncbi:MAG: HAMP domain-containing histidine kinase [Planctomycetes bacterium]|nr:HAMP domain-containing histidine kinase [Planctomycetota bacterium]
MERQDVTLSITERELFYRLGWFTQVRWAMGALALLVLLVGWYVLGVRFRLAGQEPTMAPAVEVVLAVFLYNALFTFLVHVLSARGGGTRRLTVQLAMAQLGCDMIAACVLSHWTGGVENFFIILVLLPLVIATELLPVRLAYATAVVAVLMIHGLAWGEQQGYLQHVYVEWPGKTASQYADPWYVLEVTGALTVTIFAIVLVASSISKRLRNREADLQEAFLFLRQAEEAKSFFMRKVTHEMRAPLSAIYTILGTIEHTCEGLGDEQREMIARAQKRMRGLMDLVDDLRKYSRLRSGGTPFRLRVVSLEDVVVETVKLFRPRAAAAGVSLGCQTVPAVLEADEEMLSEMATNLVSNAIQYTPQGGSVEVRLTAGQQEAVLTVSDTGIGISPEASDGIFEEFYRSPEARRLLPEGSGLGLAITRRIVELYGGSMNFRACEGGGTVFTVRLPLNRKPPDLAQRQAD